MSAPSLAAHPGILPPMLTSVQWLNRYLDPADLTADEAVRVLEAHAFPIESVEHLGNGDTRLDVEMTSNRGDAFSHINLAKDIAAATGRGVKLPGTLSGGSLPSGSGEPSDLIVLDNKVPDRCPRFTARLIRGVKVGPSPDWLVNALEAVGQRSINNIVDVSNYVLFETGHPSHTFDLARLTGSRLIIRQATEGETLTTLDEKKHTLTEDDLVVADESRAVSLAGVIGGLDTRVTDDTTDVLLEVATWDPLVVRKTARRLNINTDAGYRFARTVDMRDVPWASARAAELILEVAGGELVGGHEGMLVDGQEERPLPTITLRPERVNKVLGVDVPRERIAEMLATIDVRTEPASSKGSETELACTIPARRVHDLHREIDLIEEVARLHGFDHMEVAASLPVQLELRHPPAWDRRERATEHVHRVLTAAGFYETVTFSFLTERDAQLFTPTGLRPIVVDRERRRDAPYLRPSLVPSLMQVRKLNQDARSAPAGDARFYEIAAVFADLDDSKPESNRATQEHRNVALLMDCPAIASKKRAAESQATAMRTLRGVAESLVRTLAGAGVSPTVEPAEIPIPALAGEHAAGVSVNGERIGYVALITGDALGHFGLDHPVAVAEFGLPHLMSLYPPATDLKPLPAFPAVERDVSLVVDDALPWAKVETLAGSLDLDRLAGFAFVDAFRGKPLPSGKKSVTVRLTFRDPARTLRHEEVGPQIDSFVDAAKAGLGAEVRS